MSDQATNFLNQVISQNLAAKNAQGGTQPVIPSSMQSELPPLPTPQAQAPAAPEDFGDFAAHAINQGLLGIPEGVVNKRGLGGGLDMILGGLPSQLIEAAGGKEALKARLNKKGATSIAGDIAGNVLGMLGGGAVVKGLGLGAKALAAPGIVGKIASSPIASQMVSQGAQQAVRAGNEGSTNPAAEIAAASILGGAGAKIGMALKNKFSMLKSMPNVALNQVENQKNLQYLANAIPELRNSDIRNYESMLIGHYGNAPRIQEDISTLARGVRQNGLADPNARQLFIAQQPARWQAADKVVADKNFKLLDIKDDIFKLPSVDEYLTAAKQTGVADKPFVDALQRTNGSTANFGATRKALQELSDATYKLADNAKDANEYIAQKKLAQALVDIRDLYTDKGIALMGSADPNLAQSMKTDYAMGKLLGMGDARAAINLNAVRTAANSTTAFSMNPITGAIRNTIGPVMKNMSNKILGGANAAQSGAIADALHIPPGGAVPPLRAALSSPVAGALMPGAASPKVGGTLAAGTTNALLNQARDTGAPPPGGQGGAPVEQAGGPGRTFPGYADRRAALMGIPQSLEAQQVNTQYGYEPTPFDNAILDGIRKKFELRFRDMYIGNPQAKENAYNQYREQFLQNIHSGPDSQGRAGRGLDMNVAATALFPTQEGLRADFVKAARQAQVIDDAFKGLGPSRYAGAPVIGELFKYGPQGSKFAQLKTLLANEAGKDAADQLDKVMLSPAYPDKKQAVIDLLKGNKDNRQGWQYYEQVLGGQR